MKTGLARLLISFSLYLTLTFVLLATTITEMDRAATDFERCIYCAYGSLFRPPITIESASYSDYDPSTSSPIKITGVFESNVNQEYRISPYVSVTLSRPGLFGLNSAEVDSLLRYHYPVYQEKGSWYFRMESNLTDPVIIEPRERINFKFELYPLKAGVYNPSILLMSDNGDVFRRSTFGPTMTVSGSTIPTAGEVTQLYLPLSIGGAVMFILVSRVRKTSRQTRGYNKKENIIRLYFAVKCALETIWLSGVLFWFAFTGYPLLSPFDAVLGKAVGLTLALAAITAASYFTATTKSKTLWRISAISTSAGSILFYFFLLAGNSIWYLGYIPDPFQWRGIQYGNVAYYIVRAMPEFIGRIVSYSLPFILLPPLNANLAVAIYILASWMKEKNRNTRLGHHVMAQ